MLAKRLSLSSHARIERHDGEPIERQHLAIRVLDLCACVPTNGATVGSSASCPFVAVTIRLLQGVQFFTLHRVRSLMAMWVRVGALVILVVMATFAGSFGGGEVGRIVGAARGGVGDDLVSTRWVLGSSAQIVERYSEGWPRVGF